MAPADAARRQHQASPRAVLLNRADRVGRARRLEAARAAGKWREQQLIRANDRDGDAHARGHRLPRAAKLQQRGKKIRLDDVERREHNAGLRDRHDVQAAIAGPLVAAPEDLA